MFKNVFDLKYETKSIKSHFFFHNKPASPITYSDRSRKKSQELKQQILNIIEMFVMKMKL